MARDDSEVIPPSNVMVEHEYRVRLYLPDGRALVRRAGFGGHDMQTTGTCPPLHDNTTRRKPKGKGKK